jgi:hypothetical protein
MVDGLMVGPEAGLMVDLEVGLMCVSWLVQSWIDGWSGGWFDVCLMVDDLMLASWFKV